MRITSTGAVGIGTTTPGAKLQVTGTMKIVDGSQGAGKVLTSDASGLASWTTPSGGTFLIPAPLYSYRVSTPQATTLATAVDVTSLVSGDLPIGVYSFKSIIKFRSSATVNGIGLTLNQNTATIADLI